MVRLLLQSGVAALLSLAACGSGGGGPPQLNAGVNLTGEWNLTARVDSAQGTCTGVTVGQTQTGTIAIQQVGNQISIDLGGGNTLLGALSGVAARFNRTQASGTTTTTVDSTLTFQGDGSGFTGTVTQTVSDSSNGSTCTVVASSIGTRVTTAQLAPDTPFAAAGATVRWIDDAMWFTEAGATIALASCWCDETNGLLWLGARSGEAFDALAIAVAGQGGHWLVSPSGATNDLVVAIDLDLIGGATIDVAAVRRGACAAPVAFDLPTR